MEWLIILLVIAGFLLINWLLLPYFGTPLRRSVEAGRMRREAETEIYQQMNRAAAVKAAADNILRQRGEKP